MNETAELLAAFEACRARGAGAVLATLARVRGSHYRQPGARMLLALDGALAGVLSGGCLEEDLLGRARRVHAAGVPETVRYDLTAVGEALWGFGLGCNGEVEVLLEPLPAAGDGALAFHRRCLERRERGALATVFAVDGEVAARPGEHLALSADGAICEDGAALPEVRAALHAAASRALTGAAACTLDVTLPAGAIAVLAEPVVPAVALLLCGAGRDAVPVLRLAGELGWEVTVVDPRGSAATAERFPGAARILSGTPRALAGELAAALGIASVRTTAERRAHPDAGDAAAPATAATTTTAARASSPRPTVAVVMTHAYLDDLALLEVLLDLPLAYIGLLGPVARRDRLLADLAARGRALTAGERARLHGPAGLDIGSRTPAEIALAVLAEARAALAGRRGSALDPALGSALDPALGSAPDRSPGSALDPAAGSDSDPTASRAPHRTTRGATDQRAEGGSDPAAGAPRR